MSTETSVYIMSGTTKMAGATAGSAPTSIERTTNIAKFSEGTWTIAGSLEPARSAFAAISIEGIIMIIGGKEDSDDPTGSKT